jgi:hypothetical protein
VPAAKDRDFLTSPAEHEIVPMSPGRSGPAHRLALLHHVMEDRTESQDGQLRRLDPSVSPVA